ncbi:hypothetical protein LTR16_002114 [Cryomyces antarcticus]|uniref:Uncharacterized protein n=1 Tax=Cryomyces antarcticus TaxID=329879 RepID=A0ABR0LYU0_9PEZI|nr:hypothetical protein LTR39_001391 [Cryomyces antarcticus]KAK5018331.1 hypothetical protein LTR60_001544 [Cryomyces antarcticus]KAK5256907.1 hypothetical protein LTR16_002114 [Cryomyces antarcticus]
MSSVQHSNPSGAVPPYRDLFSSVTIVPPNTTLAYVSTQWAGDQDSNVLHPDDYYGQAKVIWTNIGTILGELGAGVKDIVHRVVKFKEFDDEIGRAVVTAVMEALPGEDEYWWQSSLAFAQVAGFHKPGIVYTVSVAIAMQWNTRH